MVDDGKAPSPAMEPAWQTSYGQWRNAIQECRAGTPVHLLNLLVQPTKTDAVGNALQMTAVPDDPELRWEIVLALLHIGRFSARLKPGDLFVREFIGTPRERVREYEIAAAAFFKETGSDSAEMDWIAASLGIQPESLERRIRQLRRKRRG